jgi:hypothetical protein
LVQHPLYNPPSFLLPTYVTYHQLRCEIALLLLANTVQNQPQSHQSLYFAAVSACFHPTTIPYSLLGPDGYRCRIWSCRHHSDHPSMCANRTGLGQNYLGDMLRYHRLLVCERKIHYCYRLDPPHATNASDMGLAAKGDTESCSFDGVCYGGLVTIFSIIRMTTLVASATSNDPTCEFYWIQFSVHYSCLQGEKP